ncbi:methyltransferase type 11 [Pyrenophora seminiperda CCB06]|uniref:Methyltransferase type 11 n=1 Tax=Pyrenophora seminiperda CCB06 TaxID=1302712 RepID=A0A3M7M1T1_9PLEO|nr:methyltransferase type 11 [Pyrenophora seminiperda CCB06]
MTREQLLDEFKALRGVRDSTTFCKTKFVHKPTWNERVHSRMLEQVVRNRPGLEYYNITTARVVKELVPGNKYGELLKNKLIDYAITIEPPLFSEDQVIIWLATSLPPLQRAINPSDYSPLCCNPVAISIETKSSDGSENGEVQLSVWAIAYFNRLRTLTQDPVSITLPLVLVSNEHWKLMFARDLKNSIEIIDAVDFGNTGDIIGCYKILAALRLLCGWVEDIFLGWFSDRVLKPE